MLKGIDNIERESQEAAAIGSGDWINTLKIKDGDVALVRFVTDKDELIRAKFHSVKKVTPRGEFTVPVYCTFEDTGMCPNCASGNAPYNTMNLWAYVYYILHKSQNPNIQAGSNEGIWAQIKQGKSILYKEEINAFRLFRTKFGYQGRYRQMFVDFAKEYGTLCDRDYSWSRVGATNKNTNYNLMPKKESQFEVPQGTMSITDLPNLGDVVCGKVRTFSQIKSNEVKESEELLNSSSEDKDLELF